MIEKAIDGRTATLGTDLLCGGEVFARKGEKVTLLHNFMHRDGTHYSITFDDGRRTSAADYALAIMTINTRKENQPNEHQCT